MSMPVSRRYWRVILYGSIVGVVLSIGILNLYYLVFVTEYTPQTFGYSVKWGTFFGLITSGFILVGTIAVARSLGTRLGKGLFIVLSVVSAAGGWLLYGVLTGLLGSWHFFFGYPVIAAVAGTMSGVVAALAMFFVPQPETSKDEVSSADKLLGLFESAS